MAGSASAQEANEVFLHAIYLGAPTEWCKAGDGVPVTLSIDGPDVFEVSMETANWVRVSRGSVGRVDHAFAGKKFDANAQTIGRLSGDFRACQNPWESRWQGAWRVTGPSGEIASWNYEVSRAPYFRFRAVERTDERATRRLTFSETRYLALGDYTLFTNGEPQQIRKIAVEAKQEQSQ